MKTKIIFLCLLSTLLVAAPSFAGGWLIYHDGSYTGKIVDAETGAPFEGAAVLGIRSLEVYGIDTRLHYIDASEATTDKEGNSRSRQLSVFIGGSLLALQGQNFSFLSRDTIAVHHMT